ncbi:MAG: hypothetical protein Q4C96_07480 [Planctomycetia bacterium]|nr:hypothetical protein [Planctomycetia bacterium]
MNFLVFTDDWGRHPSSCQHLMRFFLEEEKGHHVIWMNTIGTRTPRLDWITFRRGLGKIFQWMKWKSVEESDFVDVRPMIYHPLMIPWFRRPVERKLNRFLLQRGIRRALKNVHGPVTAVTTLPITADLIPKTGRDSHITRWVYYCVDDWSKWPGADGKTMEMMEKELLQKVDFVISAGASLQERLKSYGRDSELLTHGVDLKHWGFCEDTEDPFSSAKHFPGEEYLGEKDPQAAVQKLPNDSYVKAFSSELERPFYTFWGLIDERLDVPMILRLANDISSGTIIIAGPDASRTVVSELSHPRIFLPGKLKYKELPQLAKCSDVLIMPYRDIPVTRQMQPLKMTEYLASGRAAVMRRLPACQTWAEAADLVEDAESFSQIAQLRAQTGLPEEQKNARKCIRFESWEEKSRKFEKMLLEQ